MPTFRAAARAIAPAALAVVAATACGSSSNKSTPRPPDQAGPPVYNVELTDAGCNPRNWMVPAGLAEFRVTNRGSTKVEEMEVQNAAGHVVADAEGVKPGTTRSFVVQLEAGKTYRARCPEDAPTWGTITVT